MGNILWVYKNTARPLKAKKYRESFLKLEESLKLARQLWHRIEEAEYIFSYHWDWGDKSEISVNELIKRQESIYNISKDANRSMAPTGRGAKPGLLGAFCKEAHRIWKLAGN